MEETAKGSTAVRQLAGESCTLCLDIDLGDYNVLLLEDYTGVGNIGGKVAAGGNITLSKFTVGIGLPDDTVSSTLVAGGNLTLTEGVHHGEAWYGGSYNPEGLGCDRGCTVAQGTPPEFATHGFAERFEDLRALSLRLANLKSNVYFDRDSWKWIGLSKCLNVFEFNASDFSAWWALDVPAGSFVVINVRGESVTFPGDIGGINSFNSRRVLYNFVDAESLTAKNVTGTVLAPKAHVTFQDGVWSGGVYAVSLSQTNGPINNNLLDEIVGADCGGGTYCDGICVEKKKLGAACSSDNQCDSGTCVDGVCCNTACDGECDACNLAEYVGTCRMVSSDVQCRASEGECDEAEYCTGLEAACPADAVRGAGSSCRTASGICDATEVCDGSSKACPLDGPVPNGTNCGTSFGEWGSCEGFSDYCDPTGTESRTVTASTCGAGTCNLSSPSSETRSCTREPPGPQPCPADSESWGVCGGFSDTCDETGTQSHSKTIYSYNCATGKCEATTVNDTVACTRSTAGVQCRAAAGVCDAAESCSGGVCPADGKAPAGTSCGSGQVCTAAGVCGGCSIGGVNYATGATNPSASCQVCNPSLSTSSWSFKPANTECRAQGGACDQAEYCTGNSATCPADLKKPNTTLCRGSVDVCDVAEYCTGSSDTCPVDRYASTTKRCGDSGNECEVAAYCTGAGPSCPDNDVKSYGAACSSDGNACTSDVCDGAGSCSHEPVSQDPGMVCCSTDSVESKWIGWYLADLGRCADEGGLNYWVSEYNKPNGESTCTRHSDGRYWYYYNGGEYSASTKDGCWRAVFRLAATETGEYP